MINFYTDPLTHLIIGLALAVITCALFLVGVWAIEIVFALWRNYRHNRDS